MSSFWLDLADFSCDGPASPVAARAALYAFVLIFTFGALDFFRGPERGGLQALPFSTIVRDLANPRT
jgi:hypothetical protein